MAAGRICLGVIVGVHGVRGHLKIKAYTDNPAALDRYGPVSLDDGRLLHLKVKSARMDNFRFYMLGGGKYSYNMVSNSNATDEKARYLVITNPGFWALEYGAGTDFYFEMFCKI